MINIRIGRDTALKADDVWARIADFGNITWATGDHPVELIGEGIGMTRRIHMPELAEPIDEVLEAINPATRELTYSIPRGLPFPLNDYRATARVIPLDESHCRIEWASDCTAGEGFSREQAEALLAGVYNQLIDWLVASFGNN